ELLGADALHQRNYGQNLADARTVDPDQGSCRPRRCGGPIALVETVGMFLALLEPAGNKHASERSNYAGGKSIDAQHKRQTSGGACKLDYPQAGNSRDGGDVRRHCHVVTLLQRSQHFPESTHAALANECSTAAAGAADRIDTEPLGGDGIDFPVAMARDQYLSPMLSFYEWGQEVLAMPHGHDQRSIVGNAFVDVGRLGSEP